MPRYGRRKLLNADDISAEFCAYIFKYVNDEAGLNLYFDV